MAKSELKDLSTFRFWCQKVLPLVYDDSLSYYEVLCKVVHYINDLIDNNKIVGTELDKIQEEIAPLQDFIDNYDTAFAEELIKKYIANMIYVDISDAGYIIYHIPEGWKDVTFKTTGLDVTLPYAPEYGHLVLELFENVQGTKEEN